MTPCRIGPYETLNIIKKNLRGPGTVQQFVLFQANSILSSLVIDQLDSGTVDVLYEENLYGDQFKVLKSISYDSTGVFQFWTHPFHNSIRITITTSDQSIFGLKMTGRTDTEILRTSVKDQTLFDPDDHKGLAMVCLDEIEGLLYFLRCKRGALITDPIDAGDPFYIDGEVASTGSLQQLTQFTVGPGLERRLSQINVSTSIGGKWIADIEGGIIATGRLSSGHPESVFTFNPRRSVLAGQTFTLSYQGKAPNADISYHVQLSEV